MFYFDIHLSASYKYLTFNFQYINISIYQYFDCADSTLSTTFKHLCFSIVGITFVNIKYFQATPLLIDIIQLLLIV